MENLGAGVFLSALLFLSLCQTLANLSGPELDDESEYDYVEGSGRGPEDWWRLEEGWRVCKYGKWQSPINLEWEDAVQDWALGGLETAYWSNHAILKNRGHDVMLGWPDGAGALYIDGTAYTLRQSHWLSPAEHEFNGWSAAHVAVSNWYSRKGLLRPPCLGLYVEVCRPDLEMHMVHQAPDGNIAVVGILYKYGPCDDPFLSQFEEPLKQLAHGGLDNVTVGAVTPLRVEGLQPYYRYVGSLTTPPCTEGVVWTVLKWVSTVSQRQVQLLKDVVNDDMKNNSRPVQPRNERLIRLFPHWPIPEELASS